MMLHINVVFFFSSRRRHTRWTKGRALSPPKGVTMLIDAPATDLLTRLRRREVTSSDLIRACLDRIEALNPTVHAFLHVDREGALRAAREWDGRYARGDALPPAAGLPGAGTASI